MDVKTWMSKHGCQNMDVKTWMSKHGCQNMDVKTWMSKHGCQNMDVKTWMSKHGCQNIFLLLILFVSANALSQQENSAPAGADQKSAAQSNASNSQDTLQKKEEPKLKPAPLPVHDMGEDWIGVREADGVSTYKLKSKPQVIGTFHLLTQEKKTNLEELESKDFFEKFVRQKEERLRVINIREWKIDSHRVKKRKDFVELNASGSYKRSEGRQVFFEERQLFFVNAAYQILVISPEKRDLQRRSVRRFFNKAQQIGLSRQNSTNKKKLSKHFNNTGGYLL